jgi:hypothetical protein
MMMMMMTDVFKWQPLLTVLRQNMETTFKDMGYKVQTHELSYFHDDYGLKAGEDEEEEEDDEDEDEEGSEDSNDDDDDDDDESEQD